MQFIVALNSQSGQGVLEKESTAAASTKRLIFLNLRQLMIRGR